ncbi:hypothetical protein [Neisseria shayeganii]|nr:hypothetical protein [Neisseria shayeganii]
MARLQTAAAGRFIPNRLPETCETGLPPLSAVLIFLFRMKDKP